MAEQPAGEKTEDPTPKRLADARKDGTVAQSRELTSWAAVLAVVVVGPPIIAALARQLTAATVAAARTAGDLAHADGHEVWTAAKHLSMDVGVATVMLCVTAGLVGITVGVLQTKGLLAPKRLKPKWSHLNPKEGIKRLVGTQAAWELAKQLAKVVALTVAAWPRIADFTDAYASGTLYDPLLLAGAAAKAGMEIVRDLALVALVVAGADWAFNKRKVTRQLRMTRQQVRDEYRNTEGDPLIKSQRRARAQQMSRNRMIADAANASVVVVNPEHLAVALDYTAGVGGAPKVVARGGDHLAMRIRTAAADAGVPIVRDVPLARTLYAVCRVGEPIPTELFVAVAQTLAMVLRTARPLSGVHRPKRSALGGAADQRPDGPEPTRRTYRRSRRRKDGTAA